MCCAVICKSCEVDKVESEFYKEPRNRSGLNSTCKVCVRARNKTYIYATPAHRYPSASEVKKRWLERHRESRREWENEHNKLPEVKARRNELLRLSGYGAEMVNRRRVRKANAEGSHTHQEWIALCDAHHNVCANCGAAVKLTRDHIVPLSKGGSDDIGNIQPLCRSCNSKKGTKSRISSSRSSRISRDDHFDVF